jgi:hypothetical protein
VGRLGHKGFEIIARGEGVLMQSGEQGKGPNTVTIVGGISVIRVGRGRVGAQASLCDKWEFVFRVG